MTAAFLREKLNFAYLKHQKRVKLCDEYSLQANYHQVHRLPLL